MAVIAKRAKSAWLRRLVMATKYSYFFPIFAAVGRVGGGIKKNIIKKKDGSDGETAAD